jgi:splicing factor 3B subunit 3
MYYYYYRFLGSRPVKLFPVIVQGQSAILALSSRPWLSYTFQSRAQLVPISYTALECGSSFLSGAQQGGDGIVAIADNTLR